MSTDRGTGSAVRVAAELAGFAVLLFLTRFLARAHLIPQMDQECYVGGIAVDLLAHGLRFPIVAYAPNEYDNGTLFSGLLVALSFGTLGRSVLALKLVTHLVSAAGAVAALWLLRGCLDELGLIQRRVRWTAIAVLVVAIALAPRVVTFSSMYAVGNHVEGAAIDAILLALFSRRWHLRSAPRGAAFWALVGFALYLNKATLLVIPALGAAELALSRSSPRRLAAALGGLLLGVLPELLVAVRARGMGWLTMASKAERGARAFPHRFLDDLWTLADFRLELLAVWALAVAAGVTLLVGAARRARRAPAGDAAPEWPLTLGLVVGVTGLHLAALTVMAQGGLDSYVLYGYPTLVVLVAALAAWLCARAAAAWGDRAGAWSGVAAVGLALLIYRPDAVTWGAPKVRALWRDRAAAACSWRFAEGFMREHQHGLARAGGTREAHAIARCRSLADQAQALDCIGGIARELSWRQDGRVPGEPPAALGGAERRAYAYHWGTHRRGDAAPCGDFTDPALAAQCAAAVELECLVFADNVTRYATGRGLGRPRCEVAAPPLDGYWAAMRRDLLARADGGGPSLALAPALDADLSRCRRVFEACYSAAAR